MIVLETAERKEKQRVSVTFFYILDIFLKN